MEVWAWEAPSVAMSSQQGQRSRAGAGPRAGGSRAAFVRFAKRVETELRSFESRELRRAGRIGRAASRRIGR